MSKTSKERILKVLNAYNPWWKIGAVNPGLIKIYKRFAYYDAMKKLDDNDIKRTVVLVLFDIIVPFLIFQSAILTLWKSSQ